MGEVCAAADTRARCASPRTGRGQATVSRYSLLISNLTHAYAALFHLIPVCSVAGVDGYLAISKYPPKVLVKYPPILQVHETYFDL